MLDEIVGRLSSSKEAIIIGIEVVASCQMLRVAFDNEVSLELSSGWLYGDSDKVVFGAMDIGFFFGSDEELIAIMEEEERRCQSKLAGLKGLRLQSIEYSGTCLALNLSKGRYIKWFCLSRELLGIRVINNA